MMSFCGTGTLMPLCVTIKSISWWVSYLLAKAAFWNFASKRQSGSTTQNRRHSTSPGLQVQGADVFGDVVTVPFERHEFTEIKGRPIVISFG